MMDPFFDELSDGICLSDDGGNILYMNSAAERLLDVPMRQAVGRTLCDILCGHLSAQSVQKCASNCALRRQAPEVDAVTFSGGYGLKDSFEWADFQIQRRSLTKNLRVRCLRTAPSFSGEGRRLTIIEEAA